MSVFSGPEVPNSGLVLQLDAGNARSYPGSGTIWIDLSGTGDNETLTNGPTFDGENGGSIVFDGINKFSASASNVTYGNNTTWEAWINCTASVNTYNCFMSRYLPYFSFYNGNRLFFSNRIGGTQRTIQTAANLSLNKWYHACFTTSYDGTTNTTMKIYTNAVETATGAFAGTQDNFAYRFMVGAWNTPAVPQNAFQGKVSIVKVYNRTLSVPEIQQNFEAYRGRFGI